MKIQHQQMKFDFSPRKESSFYLDTHLGKIPSSQLGVTLVHEHIFNKYPHRKKEESAAFTLEQLDSIIRRGVNTIVDLTTYTHLGNYREILEKRGINIICCTGFYLAKYIPPSYRVATIPELVKILSKQIINGRGMTQVRPGILKIAGQGINMTPLEERLFSAIGIVQKEFKLPVATHSPKGAVSHFEQLTKSGANPEHIFFSHLDKGINNKTGYEARLVEIRKILDKGSYVLFCEFGNDEQMINISSRPILKLIRTLLDLGFGKQLLISADSNWRWRNGHVYLKEAHRGGIPRTYEYVFTKIIPSLNNLGLGVSDIKTIMVDNPKKLFEC